MQDALASCTGGDKQAQSRRGEHEVSRNPSRRESRSSRLHLWSYPPELSTHCSGPMGAIGTRLSLRPLFPERRNEEHSSDRSCREMRSYVPLPMTPRVCLECRCSTINREPSPIVFLLSARTTIGASCNTARRVPRVDPVPAQLKSPPVLRIGHEFPVGGLALCYNITVFSMANTHTHDHHHGHAHPHGHSHGPAAHPAQTAHWSILRMPVPARLPRRVRGLGRPVGAWSGWR